MNAGSEKEIFLAALELPSSERPRFLVDRCDGDDGLRDRVEALLDADRNAGRFMASPTAGVLASFADGETEFTLLQRALAGRYSLEREIGRGGMGVVYLARDVALNRAVAVKQLPTEMADRGDYRARFLREVRTAAGMSHPNIVPIHVVEEQDDLVCFVMSYVEGETLRHLVERNGPLSASEAARVMQEVAWALAHAHERGIVHRDVKPDNIMIERASGRALVTDFGIAATLDDGGSMTMDGVFVGTPLFASPEQVAGHDIDRRSDLYSLGATIFYALTGRPVFEAPTAASAFERHRSEMAPPVGSLCPDLPRALVECVDRCLVKERAARFQSGDELARSLSPVVARADDTPEAIRRVVQEIMQVSADVGGLLIFAMVGTAGWWMDLQTANGFLSGLMSFILLVSLIAGASFLAIRISEAVIEARSAMAKGYSASQLRRALRAPPEGSAAKRSLWLPLIMTGSALATAVCWFWNYYSPLPDAPGLGDDAVFIVATFGPLIVGRIAVRQALLNDQSPRGTWRRFSSLFGGMVIRLAAWRLRHRATPDVVSVPTEVFLVGSVDSLLGQLPTTFQEHLSDVPDLMQRLERHADALRSRRDEIERALAEAGAREPQPRPPGGKDSVGTLLRSRMESGREALAEAYENANARLSDVIAAIESVRLGLLRLRAGIAVPADLTGDLELAWKVGDQVDALLLGLQHADRVTKTN